MRKALVLFFPGFVFFSCSKEKANDNDQFLGTWELEQSSCGWCGTTKYPSGNGNLFILKKDATFQVWQNGSLTQQGRYFIELANDCSSEKQSFFRAPNYQNKAISITNGTLSLFDACIADGGFSFYHKLQ